MKGIMSVNSANIGKIIESFEGVQGNKKKGADSQGRLYLAVEGSDICLKETGDKKLSFKEVTQLVKDVMESKDVTAEQKVSVLRSYREIKGGFEDKHGGFFSRIFNREADRLIEDSDKEFSKWSKQTKDELINDKVNGLKQRLSPNEPHLDSICSIYSKFLAGGKSAPNVKNVFDQVDKTNIDPKQKNALKDFIIVEGKIIKLAYMLSKSSQFAQSIQLQNDYRNFLNGGAKREEVGQLYGQIEKLNLSEKEKTTLKKMIFVDSRMADFKEKVITEDLKYSDVSRALGSAYYRYLTGGMTLDRLKEQISAVKDIPPATDTAATNYLKSQQPTQAETHASTPATIAKIYANLKTLRDETGFTDQYGIGGAGSVANNLPPPKKGQPPHRIGVVLAANSGQPGGKLAEDLPHEPLSSKQLNYTVQEESVLSNVMLTHSPYNVNMQKDFFNSSIKGQWGLMNEYNWMSPNNMTRQGEDFSLPFAEGETTSSKKYNKVFVVDNCRISNLENAGVNAKGDPQVKLGNKSCEVRLIFADSVNANAELGSSGGSMKRTLNPNAVANYEEFLLCVKEKMRATIDGSKMQQEGGGESDVTVLLMAQLSGGIYAGLHREKFMKRDKTEPSGFEKALNEVLNEPVGPNGEKRGQYFSHIIVPKLATPNLIPNATPNANSA